MVCLGKGGDTCLDGIEQVFKIQERVGRHYLVKVSNRLTVVHIIGICPTCRTCVARNCLTGRRIHFFNLARLRREVPKSDLNKTMERIVGRSKRGISDAK